MALPLENSRKKPVLAIEPWEHLGRIEMPGVSEGRQPRGLIGRSSMPRSSPWPCSHETLTRPFPG